MTETVDRPAPTTTAAKKTVAPAAAKPKKRAEPKVLPKLDFSAIEVREATPDLMRDHRRTRVERDADQVAVDTLVRQAHERWVNAGRPESWVDSATGYALAVPKAQQEALETRIRRAGAFFSVSIRFGTPKDLGNGKVRILFFAKDRSEKDASDEEATGSDAGNES